MECDYSKRMLQTQKSFYTSHSESLTLLSDYNGLRGTKLVPNLKDKNFRTTQTCHSNGTSTIFSFYVRDFGSGHLARRYLCRVEHVVCMYMPCPCRKFSAQVYFNKVAFHSNPAQIRIIVRNLEC